MGPGWSGEFWKRLCWGQFPRSLRPSVPVSVLDQQPDHQKPAGLHHLCGWWFDLWNRSPGFPLSSSAAVHLTHPLLFLCPVIGRLMRMPHIWDSFVFKTSKTICSWSEISCLQLYWRSFTEKKNYTWFKN